MGILNFDTNTNTSSNSNNGSRGSRSTPFGNQSNGQDRARSKLWLNVGYDVNGKFVNLPIGLGIDTMEAAQVRGQNEDFVKLRTAQNELLKALQDLGAKFAPGQEQEINLICKLRRVNEDLEIAKEENEYSVDLASMLLKTPASQQGELKEAAE